MNSINKIQNSDKNLGRIFFFRKHYTYSKWMESARLAIELILVVCGAFFPFSKMAADYRGYAILLAVCMLVGVAILKYFQGWFRQRAAIVQDLFDRELYGFTWNNSNGKEPSEKDIIDFKNKRLKELEGDEQKLLNWYVDVIGLPPYKAIALCQKDNVLFERSNRKFYSFVLLAVISVVVVFGALWNLDYKLTDALMNVLPFIPLFFELLFRLKNNYDATKSLNDIESVIETTLVSSGGYSVMTELDRNQCSICDYRKTVTPVPDWVFWLRRDAEHINRDEYFQGLKKNILANSTGSKVNP